MALRSTRTYFLIVLLLMLSLTFFAPAQIVNAVGNDLPSLDDFINAVRNGEAENLVGIYVPEVLADRIVSQPQDDPGFVSGEDDALTQFGLASTAGSTGLLAHNYLAGEDFFQMKYQQTFSLIYGDGHTQMFAVTQILRFHALEPDSIHSEFLDLNDGSLLTASDLFYKVYQRPGDVVLQTCIRLGGEASWGRLFIVAEPYTRGEAGAVLQPIRGKYTQ